MGNRGHVGEPSVELFQAMAYADKRTPLGDPDIRSTLLEKKGEKSSGLNRKYRAPLFVTMVIIPFVLVYVFYEGSACCTVGLFVGIILFYAFVVTMILFGYVMEDENGYWKIGDKDYESSEKSLEATLVERKIISESVDVSRFFQVSLPTRFYSLVMSPPPVYIIVWRCDGTAYVHIGPKGGGDDKQLKDLADSIAWSV